MYNSDQRQNFKTWRYYPLVKIIIIHNLRVSAEINFPQSAPVEMPENRIIEKPFMAKKPIS